ncbi:MAG: alpha/beta hydrolase [Clostridiales bacterium]|nr:alpha/beta hydrolase [Clostridiales bacterium]
MNATSYGKVEYFTLKDTKNLSYLANNSKKISVYTPNGYTTGKKYGVLYMFDSQNLYTAAEGADKSSDSYGSWAVDVAVTDLVQNCGDGIIIVAIDNTDGYRDSELTMSQSFGKLTNLADNSSFYSGKLDELGNFMEETLMPFVREQYSVDTSREHTGIAGSSSGGLAAYYLGLRDNDLYGYIGAFSPANGLFETSAWSRFYANKDFSLGRPKIYVYCGKGDNSLEDMLLPATKEIVKLTSYGFNADSIIENYVSGGTHSENYWRTAFVEFLNKMIG